MINVEQDKKLISSDFEKAFGERLSQYVKNKIEEYDFIYSEIPDEERDHWLRRLVDVLLDPNLVYSGKHRIDQWEEGWGENLNELITEKKIEKINPHYFSKYPVLRFMQKYIKPISVNFERNSLYVIQNWLFDKYVREAENIYEFGCGTGHNLFLARDVNPKVKIWGLDWTTSSQKIIKKLVEEGIDKNMDAYNFDFFEPDYGFKLGNKSVVYTVASLEQIGDQYMKFVEYLLENKPELCIHIEPIGELLDENNLLDYLSIKYFKKRKYLDGFLTKLRELEKEGKIEILKQQRTYIGSLFIDGYSVVVWRVL
ncbi:MAG: class I SAM-dependent methyltransferase [Candidatus Falkowbacteria bacterium]|nr:class I SAM-dependent methyltransferase [Candidatus Falkowbacteria bacterium]